ncbi:hypothetical protein VaNZ11_015169 [Volvox africanus]|uniref:RNA polymerase II transcription factor B subunit 2 n=1 Tax=Volvox africanus TaxID=51714 RepID=A0ABQ5SLN5_9CHLO|nr:hypothetical protein VaNZ11_015169 [Volvox africanus]
MDFTAYISNLSSDKRTLLYRSPWTSLAVFRNLPPLAQVYVMRLLFVPSPFPTDFLNSWARRSSASSHKAALTALKGLDVLKEHQCLPGQPPPAPGGNAGFGAVPPGSRVGGLAPASQQQQQPQPPKVVWALHPDFRAQLQRVVCFGAHLMRGDVPAAAAVAAPSLEQLGEWATRQWEALQLFMLGAGRAPPGLPPLLRNSKCPDLDLRGLLMEAGLLAFLSGPGGGGARGEGGLAVTQRGFHFLLQAPDRQLWAVLREYIKFAEGHSSEDLASTLSFLLQLGFRRVGQPCPWGELRQPEQRMAAHMVQLGLLAVFQAADGSLYYTPTRLASSLCGGAGAAAAAAIAGDLGGGITDRTGVGVGGVGGRVASAGNGVGGAAGGLESGGVSDAYIIVESNYRVYAYTRSPVTIAVLELFVKREALLPNLFVGAIRRDSILAALSRGITAEELVSYLAARPHPSVASRSPVVPEVVSDQIRLWEASMNRLRADAAVLYENMESRELFQRAVAFAQSSGTLLWEDSTKMKFAALDAGHEAMKDFIVRAKQEVRQ